MLRAELRIGAILAFVDRDADRVRQSAGDQLELLGTADLRIDLRDVLLGLRPGGIVVRAEAAALVLGFLVQGLHDRDHEVAVLAQLLEGLHDCNLRDGAGRIESTRR
jgi:hypothetical protein